MKRFLVNKKNIKINVLYFTGLSLIICNELFNMMYFGNIISGGLGYIIGISLLSIKLITDKGFFKQGLVDIVIQSILLMIGCLTYISTRQSEILTLSLIVVSSHNVNYGFIKKFYVYLISTLYITNLFLIILSLKQSSMYFIASPGHKEYAHMLGFQHPNNAILIIVCVYLCYILLINKDIGIISNIIFLILGIIGYILTDGRMSLFVILCTFLLIIISKTKLKAIFNYNFFAALSLIVCAAMSIILGVMFGGKRLIESNFLNTIVSRIMMWDMAISKSGIHAFGVKADFIGPLDLGYYHILFNYGYISLIIFIIAYIVAIIKNCDNQYYGIVCMMIFIIAVIDRKVIQSYFLLPLIGLVADNDTSLSKENVYLDNRLKCINYAVIGGIVTLLIGHQIYQYLRENQGFRTIVNIVRITDILFIIIGFVIGLFIYSMKQKVMIKNVSKTP